MEELIIIALIVGTGYYFLTHQKEETKSQPLTQTTSQSTQTEPITEKDNQELEQTLDTLIKNIRQLNRELK